MSIPTRDAFSDQSTPISDLSCGVIVTARKGPTSASFIPVGNRASRRGDFIFPATTFAQCRGAYGARPSAFPRRRNGPHEAFHPRENPAGFSIPEPEDLPNSLSIRHLGSDEHYDFDLSWNPDGTAELDWEIPKSAKLGEYQITMVRRQSGWRPRRLHDSGDSGTSTQFISGSFRVEEFRVPLMRGAIRMPAVPQVAVSSVPIDVSAEYLSGGAAKGLPVDRSQPAQSRRVSELSRLREFHFRQRHCD